MSTPRPADLPIGSKVRNDSGDLIAERRTDLPAGWWVDGLGHFWDYEITDWLKAGGEVLRVGDGSDR